MANFEGGMVFAGSGEFKWKNERPPLIDDFDK
jgi:hypothetical protein